MKPKKLTAGDIDSLIIEIRGQKVILDAGLASIYGVPTRRLNEQFRRNIERFPEDFAFQLTREEWREIKALTPKALMQATDSQALTGNRS